MDSLCFTTGGIHGVSSSASSSISFNGGHEYRAHPAQISALGSSNATGISMENSTVTTTPFGFSFGYPLRSLWSERRKEDDGVFDRDEASVFVVGDGEGGEEVGVDVEGRENEVKGNWVLKILHVKSLWSSEQGNNGFDELGNNGFDELVGEEKNDDQIDGCPCCDDDEEVKFDANSFSRLLRRVSLPEAKLYAQMSYLGKLAYSTPKLKPGNLFKYHGLRFVTSSVEKKTESPKDDEKEKTSAEVRETEKNPEEDAVEGKEQNKANGYRISASDAYQIAASAASYLHSHTKSMLPFKSSTDETTENLPSEGNETIDKVEITSSEVASFVATTNSVTAVVAGKEEMKQAVAKDLNSAHSSPCEWFICDDDQSGTRFFVIQGSESLASWQANLLFEPIQFEGLDVLVHRGIYEAAKGIYEKMLPEVHAHLKSHGDSATFRFTGHSLGGSLSLLVNLMLLIRGEVPHSSLLPVIMFGAPSIMCGGDQLLHKLGLPRSHVQAIMMHRDIVPRAFSCNYPDHVAEILKALNGNFRNYPCLKNQKLLYSPMGELLILQPDAKFSPHHHLLPPGSGLYLLSCPMPESGDAEKKLRAARAVFLNSPHPLEILSDRSAYGSDGTIYRDHDVNSYHRSVRGVLRQELNLIRKAKREQRRQVWWPLIHTGAIVGRTAASSNIGLNQLNFSGVIQTGSESLKRFSRFVASQHKHLLIVLLFPTQLLLLGAYAVISFR